MAAVLWSGVLAASLLAPSQEARADVGATHTSLVSEFATFDTPGVVDGRVEDIAIDGDTVFVGGSFTQVREPRSGEIIDQPYLFAYSKSTGRIIRDFDPVLNRKVLALETTGEGTGVFAGGAFTTINGETNRRGLVKIGADGDRVFGFGARPDARINTLVRMDDTLYLGGSFTSVSQTQVENLAAVNTSTGAVSPGLNLDFDGTISTTRTVGVQGVDDIDITSDGRLMVLIGNFLSIDGISRSRLAVLELDGQARVSTWNSDVYDVQCPASKFPQYIRGIDIAPDDAYFIAGSSGWRFFNRPTEPACDSVVRFDFGNLDDADVQPTWVNYTGGDSVFDVVSTDHAIYAGGHFRWLNNDTTSDGRTAGPGSVPRRGLAAIDPANGLTLLDWRSDRSPRGVGVFAMIAEDEGLYIGDDTDFLNGSEHAKLKFLPITSDTLSRPTGAVLPTTLVTPRGSALDGSSFDGTTLGTPLQMLDAGWGNARGAMFVGGQLFHADGAGRMWSSQLEDGTFEPAERVNMFGLGESEWALSRLGGMFFDYERGRVYYTVQGDSRLLWRAFTPAGPYFGNEEQVAEQQGDIPWSNVSGMDVVGDHLYFGYTNGYLYRADFDGSAVVSGTIRLISGPNTDGRDWNNNALAFLSESVTFNGPDDAQFEFEASGSTEVRRFKKFEFPVAPGEPVVVRLDWQNANAVIRFFLRDANGELVDSDTTSAGSPKWLSAPAGAGGTYTASIAFRAGSSAYTLQVNPEQGPPPPPEPRADFDFTSSGTESDGSWQVFRFDVTAGELVEAQIAWDDPNAEVKVFLRDETRRSLDSDTDRGASPAALSTVAQTSGEWSIAVKIDSGAIEYDVLVNTTTDFVVPESLAEFEFSSSGSDVDGSWQVFRFDVEVGEQVDARVVWDNPDAAVKVFLRDETRSSIDSVTDGSGSPAMMSAVATSAGKWSVAVKINSGVIDYDVLVDTTSP